MLDKIFDLKNVKAIKYADWVDYFDARTAGEIMDQFRVLTIEEVYDEVPGDLLILIEKNKSGLGGIHG